MSNDSPDSTRRFLIRYATVEDQLVGARWWNQSFAASETIGRRQLAYWVGGGALALVLAPFVCSDDDDDEIQTAVDALELQRREGWNVGHTDQRIVIPHGTALDAEGGRDFATTMMSLAHALTPTDPRLVPYYVPTLFQVLAQPGSQFLRDALYPMRSPGMVVAHDKSRALGALIDDAKTPNDLALVLDLPGPEAVAAAAALADRATPVFVFDNWPHPLGVVPAHHTLAATLHYLPRFLRAAHSRPSTAPPVFVLDDARLSPYRDEVSQFDNRYMARLPSADGMKGIGVRRLLYVRPAGTKTEELDDLNEDFVAYRDAGIDVKLTSLGDFMPAPDPRSGETRQYWGGSPQAHVHFWPMYGWYRPLGSSSAPGLLPGTGSTRRAAPQPPAPPPALAYQPAPRPTLFSSRTIGGLGGVGKQKPSGFGRVSVRTSRSTGAVTGVASGRSGSFGRSRSSWSG